MDNSNNSSKLSNSKHKCHWPGCNNLVPPAMWGCRDHWFKLPKTLRDEVWTAYVSGQEITKDPSPEYIRVAGKVQDYIKLNFFPPEKDQKEFYKDSSNDITNNTSECKGCGKTIGWVVTENGKKMPINTKEITIVTLDGKIAKGYTSHFATCANADEFRRKK